MRISDETACAPPIGRSPCRCIQLRTNPSRTIWRRWRTQIRKRFDVVLDTAGTLSTGQCSRMLPGKGLALHLNPSFAKMLMVGLSRRNKLVFLKTSSDLSARVSTMAANGKLNVPIGKTVPLADATPAVVDLERTGTPKGKVIIVPA